MHMLDIPIKVLYKNENQIRTSWSKKTRMFLFDIEFRREWWCFIGCKSFCL